MNTFILALNAIANRLSAFCCFTSSSHSSLSSSIPRPLINTITENQCKWLNYIIHTYFLKKKQLTQITRTINNDDYFRECTVAGKPMLILLDARRLFQFRIMTVQGRCCSDLRNILYIYILIALIVNWQWSELNENTPSITQCGRLLPTPYGQVWLDLNIGYL